MQDARFMLTCSAPGENIALFICVYILKCTKTVSKKPHVAICVDLSKFRSTLFKQASVNNQ